ncbi:hypothetical protein VPNG_06443 [Cytospora leucostoma]|uniref:Uncharacterized protein n=1 Tax=Cytospora leucostoma TaxID=1230097 RepID=A0A423WYQ6_9PEZI|nr:hypothetical protein VPNG_06443 [Cytospora leucostoma]
MSGGGLHVELDMSANNSSSPPGCLLRLTVAIYRNAKDDAHVDDDFGRDYVVKASAIAARHGIEIYQQDHNNNINIHFRTFGKLAAVDTDPDFQDLQAPEGPYINLLEGYPHIVTRSWIERYVDNGEVIKTVQWKVDVSVAVGAGRFGQCDPWSGALR